MSHSATLGTNRCSYQRGRTQVVEAITGIVLTWIGTLFALSAMPPDPTAKGALVQSGLWQAAGLLVMPAWQLTQNWRGVLRCEYLLTAGLIVWLLLDIIQASYAMPDLSPGDIENVFLAIGVMATAVWLGTMARPWPLPKSVVRSATYPFNARDAYRLVLVLFGLGISKYVIAVGFDPIAMFEYLGRGRWAAPWSRGRLGGWGAFLDHMAYFGYAVPALTVVYGHHVGWKKGKTVLAIFCSLVITLLVAQQGGRRIIGVMLGSALVCWVLLHNRFLLHNRLRPKVVLGAVLGLVLMGYALQFILENRSKGLAEAESFELRSEDFHIDDNFYRLGQTIRIFPEEHPYVYWDQVTYVLVRPIPRVFWPGKPTNPGYNFASMVTDQRVSLSTSVIGEFFASWGWLAIFLGGYLYGRLGKMWNRLLHLPTPYAVLMYGIGALALFVGLRSMLDLVLMSYIILAWIGLTYLFEHRPEWTSTGQPAPRRRSV